MAYDMIDKAPEEKGARDHDQHVARGYETPTGTTRTSLSGHADYIKNISRAPPR